MMTRVLVAAFGNELRGDDAHELGGEGQVARRREHPRRVVGIAQLERQRLEVEAQPRGGHRGCEVDLEIQIERGSGSEAERGCEREHKSRVAGGCARRRDGGAACEESGARQHVGQLTAAVVERPEGETANLDIGAAG